MAEPNCTVEWCVKPATRDALCKRHWQYRETHGRLPYGPHYSDDRSRLYSRIVKQDDGCWIWTGAQPRKKVGYGIVRFRGVNMSTHRAMWLLERGPIPDGLEIDHLCRNRRCCNPDHLEPVTSRENTRRGLVTRSTSELCANGHPWLPDNRIIRKSDGAWECRACNREKTARYRVRRAEAVGVQTARANMTRQRVSDIFAASE